MKKCSTAETVRIAWRVFAQIALHDMLTEILSPRNRPMTHALTVKDFSSYLNTDFHARSPCGNILSLKLVQAAGAPPAGALAALTDPHCVVPPTEKLAKVMSSAKAEGRDGGQFSLQFAGPRHFQASQGTYILNHPKLGRLEVFMVPAGKLPNDAGYGYNAIFN